MYFTAIDIDPNRRASARILGSRHRFHGAIMACFPRDHDPGRTLWRLDEREDGPVAYLVSEMAPEIDEFVKAHAHTDGHRARTRPYGDVLESIVSGERYAFRVEVNPIKQIVQRAEDGTRLRSKRVPHLTAAHQLHWFTSKAEAWGLKQDGLEDNSRVVQRQSLKFMRGNRRVSLVSAVIEGQLEVRDVELFRAQLVAGFGKAKAYGCGLMTLARV